MHPSLTEGAANIQEGLENVQQRLATFIRQRPATSLLIALGAGFLVGRLLRL